MNREAVAGEAQIPPSLRHGTDIPSGHVQCGAVIDEGDGGGQYIPQCDVPNLTSAVVTFPTIVVWSPICALTVAGSLLWASASYWLLQTPVAAPEQLGPPQ